MSRYDTFHADWVEANTKLVGLSTWTGYSANERATVSLGTVETELAKPGIEVTIVWGEDKPSSKAQVEEHLQLKIRAKVMPVSVPSSAPRARPARWLYVFKGWRRLTFG